MCSTPKGSGSSFKSKRFIDEADDYESYSKMMRRASDQFDKREAQHKRQAETSTLEIPGSKSPDNLADEVQRNSTHGSIFSRLLNYLE
jgi:hypothetical protein